MIDQFLEHRPLLFSIAYRMLGSVAEAEDAVQDTFLRWQRVTEKKEEIRSSKAWLVATVTRLSIDRLRSTQRQREQYVGVWLPEPLVAATIDSHNQCGALADSISTAFMVMLETLTPEERAIFILREAFDYNYNDISAVVGKSEANCRQIARRAKEHLSRPGRRRPIVGNPDKLRAPESSLRPAKDQHTILKMESLPEKGKSGRRDHNWSRPKRHPKNGLFAGRSLRQPQNG